MTQPLRFPAPIAQPVEQAPGSSVEIRPNVGAGVELAYKDADGNIRLLFRCDETLKWDDVLFFKKMLGTFGDSLPPRSPPRTSLFGPRPVLLLLFVLTGPLLRLGVQLPLLGF